MPLPRPIYYMLAGGVVITLSLSALTYAIMPSGIDNQTAQTQAHNDSGLEQLATQGLPNGLTHGDLVLVDLRSYNPDLLPDSKQPEHTGDNNIFTVGCPPGFPPLSHFEMKWGREVISFICGNGPTTGITQQLSQSGQVHDFYGVAIPVRDPDYKNNPLGSAKTLEGQLLLDWAISTVHSP